MDDDANCITKCSPDGTRLMMILPEGRVLTRTSEMQAMRGVGATPPPHNSGRMFNRPTDIAVHPITKELYVTDGYGNNVVHRLHGDGIYNRFSLHVSPEKLCVDGTRRWITLRYRMTLSVSI